MKQLIQIYFYTIVLSIILLVIGFYSYDPLQIFHKPWGRETTFHSNMRQQAAGITNNYHFDSIIIGSSMLENTSANESSDKLGGHFVNISLSGSTYYERLLVMKYIFEKKSIKKVIYSLDAASYIHQQKEYPGFPGYPLESFDYLYDDKVLNDFKAYLNYDFLKCLLTFSTSEKCIGFKTTLDKPNDWFKDQGNSIRFGGIDKWLAAKNNERIKSAFKDIVFQTEKIKRGEALDLKDINIKISQAKTYVDETILTFVKNHPKTEFNMLFPPYSRANYALWAQYNLPFFEVHKAIIEYFVSKSIELPNLKVFTFGNHTFLDDIRNYKDTTHHHPSINSWMLTKIQEDARLLTPNDVERYLQNITRKAQSYNVLKMGNLINKYLQTSQN